MLPLISSWSDARAPAGPRALPPQLALAAARGLVAPRSLDGVPSLEGPLAGGRRGPAAPEGAAAAAADALARAARRVTALSAPLTPASGAGARKLPLPAPENLLF